MFANIQLQIISFFRCLKIVKDVPIKTNSNNNQKDILSKIDFKTAFTIKYSQQQDKPSTTTTPKQQDEPQYSISGRLLQKRILHEASELLPSEIIHAIDYEDELDILAVLYTHTSHDIHKNDKNCISLYDNKSGHQLRTFEMVGVDVSDEETFEWNLFIDGLTIIGRYGLAGCNASKSSYVFSYLLQTNTIWI